MKRRQFLGFVASTMAMAALPVQAGVWAADFAAIRLPDTGMNKRQWVLIEKVQRHLFPAEKNAPGAQDINATAYLQWVLSDPELQDQDKAFFANGLSKLQRILITTPDMEKALRLLEQKSAGRSWITELLHYIFEALLTDPVYGGNPNAIGWKWLQHNPGFRRPAKQNRYFLL